MIPEIRPKNQKHCGINPKNIIRITVILFEKEGQKETRKGGREGGKGNRSSWITMSEEKREWGISATRRFRSSSSSLDMRQMAVKMLQRVGNSMNVVRFQLQHVSADRDVCPEPSFPSQTIWILNRFSRSRGKVLGVNCGSPGSWFFLHQAALLSHLDFGFEKKLLPWDRICIDWSGLKIYILL